MRHARMTIGALAISAAALAPLAATATATKTNTAPRGGGPTTGDVSLRVLAPTPNEVVTGATLPLHVIARGYRLDAYYAGTPVAPAVGHYHEILDGKLIDMTPLIDPTHDQISMVGVTPGRHTLTLAPARNDHSMIMAKAVNIPFSYKGPYLPEPAGYTGTGSPSIAITSPAAGSTVHGKSFDMTAAITNFAVCGDCFGKALVTGEGHWHIFLDSPTMPHMLTMAGSPTQTVPLKGVKPGKHTFYAVLVNNQHTPAMTPVMTSVTLTVR